jgi:hypothetical protein
MPQSFSHLLVCPAARQLCCYHWCNAAIMVLLPQLLQLPHCPYQDKFFNREQHSVLQLSSTARTACSLNNYSQTSYLLVCPASRQLRCNHCCCCRNAAIAVFLPELVQLPQQAWRALPKLQAKALQLASQLPGTEPAKKGYNKQ